MKKLVSTNTAGHSGQPVWTEPPRGAEYPNVGYEEISQPIFHLDRGTIHPPKPYQALQHLSVSFPRLSKPSMQKDSLDTLQGAREIVQPGRAQLRFLASSIAMSDEKP